MKQLSALFAGNPAGRRLAALAALLLIVGASVATAAYAHSALGAGDPGRRPAAAPAQESTPYVDPIYATQTAVALIMLPPSPLETPLPPTPVDPTSIEVQRATINSPSGANMRAAANVNAGVVAVLGNGERHVVSQGPLTGGDAAQWVELALPGGGRGWIKAELVLLDSVRLAYADAAALLSNVGMVVPQPGAIPPTTEPPTMAPGLLPPDPLTQPVTSPLTVPVDAPVTVPETVPVTVPLTVPVGVTLTVPVTAAVAPLTVEQLRAAAWIVPSINVTGTIQFVEGAFANQETGLRVVLTDTLVAVGDITGDGAADAAAILQVTQPDGSVSYDLVVAVNQGATPVAVSGVRLGAPLVIEELRIEKGAIWLEMRVVGPGDDACCPSLSLKRIYVLRGDELVELPAASYGRTFPYRYGTLYGYVNVLGEFVVPPQFQFAGDYSEGLALVSLDGKRFGFINRLGQVAIPFDYSFATPFAGGLTVAGLLPAEGVTESEQVVYLDRAGLNIFGEQTFAAGQPFSDGLAAVKVEGGKFGYIDRSGEVVVPAEFDFALAFSEGLAPVLENDRVGYINRTGSLVIPVQYDAGGLFSEGLAAVAISGTVGYIDHSGEYVVEPTLERGSPFIDGLAAVSVEGAESYIDASGEAVIMEPAFTNAQEFSEGLAAVRVDELFGYMSTRGELAIAPQFTVANPFRQGLAMVETADSWGVIAHDGTWLVQLSLLPLTTTTSTAGTTSNVTVELETPALPTTDIISFVPAVPDEIRAGACYGGSDVVGVRTAWRCGLVGGEVYDPCLIAADSETIVCGADPATGEAGFALELTQPLPTDAVEAKATPGAWIFELESGAICRYTQGTSVIIEGERVNYACSDRTQLLGEIDKNGDLWTIDAITTAGTTESGLRVETRTPLSIPRTWLPGLVEAAESGS